MKTKKPKTTDQLANQCEAIDNQCRLLAHDAHRHRDDESAHFARTVQAHISRIRKAFDSPRR